MRENKTTILVVEDDAKIKKFICYALQQAGFSYVAAESGEAGLAIIASRPIDLILLDLGLPDMDGTQVLQKVREWSDIPIIVVSARDQDQEKATVLDNGADDYLTKPFSATELLARVRVAFRHCLVIKNSAMSQLLAVGGLQLDLAKHQVFLDEKPLHVTPLEYKLLALLLKNRGKVLTTVFILKEIYGVGYGPDTQALRALMAGLRRKIEKDRTNPRYIFTEIGVGYRLAES